MKELPVRFLYKYVSLKLKNYTVLKISPTKYVFLKSIINMVWYLYYILGHSKSIINIYDFFSGNKKNNLPVAFNSFRISRKRSWKSSSVDSRYLQLIAMCSSYFGFFYTNFKNCPVPSCQVVLWAFYSFFAFFYTSSVYNCIIVYFFFLI